MDNKVMCPYCGQQSMVLRASDMFDVFGGDEGDDFGYWYKCDECSATSPVARSINDAYVFATRFANQTPDPETIAAAVHDAWWEEKKRQGITDHPDMVPYDQLSESAKEYDRATARAVLQAMGVNT